MAWKVIVSPSALADLENIVSYIARHNRSAAEKLGNLLIARAEALAKFPEIGRVVPEYQDRLKRSRSFAFGMRRVGFPLFHG